MTQYNPTRCEELLALAEEDEMRAYPLDVIPFFNGRGLHEWADRIAAVREGME